MRWYLALFLVWLGGACLGWGLTDLSYSTKIMLPKSKWVCTAYTPQADCLKYERVDRDPASK